MLNKKKLTETPRVVVSKSPTQMIVGIDEVGRGAFAGPVSVGAFMISEEQLKIFKKMKTFSKLRDSKKLSKIKRDEWYGKIEEWNMKGTATSFVAHVQPKVIDTKGLTFAIQSALETCLKKLEVMHTHNILLDGGLRAPKDFLNQKTIIKGDEKEIVIALASIAAKVTRDRLMMKMRKKYPEYGFEKHVGYGTKMHVKAIVECGVLPIHRKLFLRKRLSS